MSTLTPDAKQLLSTTIRALRHFAPWSLDDEAEVRLHIFRELEERIGPLLDKGDRVRIG